MTRTQQIVAVLYCLLVAYCCAWVPWVANNTVVRDYHQGYGWVWNPPTEIGVPSLTVIATRILAATALGAAAFLLARKWKALLLVAALAGAGILLYGYWTDKIAKRQERDTQREAQKIHDCAVAKVATVKCTPYGEFNVCDSYLHSDNPTAQEEDAAIATAEKDCTSEMEPKKKSAHEQIEEYKLQHGIKQ